MDTEILQQNIYLKSQSLQDMDSSTYLYFIVMPIVNEYYNFNSSDEAYQTMVMKIDQAVKDGTLSVLMQYSGVKAFASANASKYITTYDYLTEEVPGGTDSSNDENGLSNVDIVGIIIGCILFGLTGILIAVLYSSKTCC